MVNNVTFAGFEATVKIGATTVAVAERVEATMEQDLEEVSAIGDFKPQDLKEVFQRVSWKMQRAYFTDTGATDFFTNTTRTAGYLPVLTITAALQGGGGAGDLKTFTISGAKVSKYGLVIPAGKGVIVESLEGKALNMTKA